MEILTEIESMHEQREQFDDNLNTPIEKGVWLEVIDFDPHTEKAEVLLRLEIEDIIKTEKDDINIYKIVCNELDVVKDQERKEEIAKKIIDKHNDKLKASFAKCLVDGIGCRTIPELKIMLTKLGGKTNDKQEDNK